VLLLDEIDKLGSDYKGDPASALLEVLDAEQNHTFRDHYIEIPFDLSDVMFILTANVKDTIPRALLDRMEVIELPSYTDEEKVAIAREHLIPKQLKRHGLTKRNVKIGDDSIRELIAGYTREAGVRTLERTIASCLRKAAREIAENKVKQVIIDSEKIFKYLGPYKYKREQIGRENRVGAANGLAWTSVGGELLTVEANVLKGTGKVELTGNLGEVMKESARAAISFIRSRSESLLINPDFYKDCDIHVHFPEGAIPKDGPSAGITIVTAIVSALTSRAVYRDIAMTGEITLRGKVLPVGGLGEKTMAAFRAGVKRVIIPAENEPDLYEIDEIVKKNLQFITVENADEVLAVALEPVKKAECADLCPLPGEISNDKMEVLRS
jgi:ATP-dependent Lon protease